MIGSRPKRPSTKKLGHKYQKVAELEDDPIVPRCCYTSTESVRGAESGSLAG